MRQFARLVPSRVWVAALELAWIRTVGLETLVGGTCDLAADGRGVPDVLGERELVEAHAEPRAAGACRHRLTLLVGGQVTEVLVELLGGDRLEPLAAVDRGGARIGPDHQPAIVEHLVHDVFAVQIASKRDVRGHKQSVARRLDPRRIRCRGCRPAAASVAASFAEPRPVNGG